jgi:hypothetical protein
MSLRGGYMRKAGAPTQPVCATKGTGGFRRRRPRSPYAGGGEGGEGFSLRAQQVEVSPRGSAAGGDKP